MLHLSEFTRISLAIVLIVVVSGASGFIFQYGKLETCENRAQEREERLKQKWRDPYAWKYYKQNPHLKPKSTSVEGTVVDSFTNSYS